MKAPINEQHTLPVVEEQVTIRKRNRVTETLQAHTVTHEHDQPVEADLSVQTIRIERVPCDRFVDHPIADRQEGDTTIISVVEEVATVTLRLKLVEEVRITRDTRHPQIRRHGQGSPPGHHHRTGSTPARHRGLTGLAII
ncbi:YsnF/AvaK domain-containing protein [Azospirillum aestuarii]|uniref:YsnF/AvaK domain-containing protein n=1 Tax=Azospirillum aestuarii TaxID=2802052 RepID=UPI00405522FF